jgi:SH3-like domain-containing protein
MKRHWVAALCVATALLIQFPAQALEFGSAATAVILYDAPARSAAKVAVINPGYPLEKIITSNGWVKVRDETGALAWIEASALNAKRTLVVTAPMATVLEKPLDTATLRFRAQHGVILDLISPLEGAWVKVRHASGGEGYTKIHNVWGL